VFRNGLQNEALSRLFLPVLVRSLACSCEINCTYLDNYNTVFAHVITWRGNRGPVIIHPPVHIVRSPRKADYRRT